MLLLCGSLFLAGRAREDAGIVARVDLDDVYRRHGHSVLRRAKRVLGNADEAHEVLQEIFLELVRDPSQFEGRSSIATFLYRVTTNRCLNRLRDRKNRERLVREHVAPSAGEGGPASAHEVASAQELLSRLPEEQAQVAVYYFYDELSQQEIADVMGCSRRHVGNLLERLLAALRSEEAADAGASRA